MRSFFTVLQRGITTKNYLVIITMLLILIGLPLTIITVQKQQTLKQKASASTVLSFSPSSSTTNPIVKTSDSTLVLDVMLNPGTNAVASVIVDINYDPTKFVALSGTPIFTGNTNAFPKIQTILNSAGRLTIQANIGTDATKVIQTTTKVGTLTLKVNTTLADTQTISFGSQSAAYGVTTSQTTPQTVLSGTIPAYIASSSVSNLSKTSSTSPTPSVPIGGACSTNVATDTILIIDRSSSMKDELSQAKSAAKSFVDQAAKNSENRIGVVTFENKSSLVTSLSNKFSDIKSDIDDISLGSGTCTQCGIDKANAEIQSHGRAGVKKVFVLMTDGRANIVSGMR